MTTTATAQQQPGTVTVDEEAIWRFRLGLASAVRGRMREAGLTIADTCEATGMSQSTLSRRLNARLPFLLGELGKVASLLGCSIAEIVVEAEESA